jgi:RecB family exonuclease
MSVQLGLEGMPTALVKVTPSRLATWDDCRRRFRMTYLDRPAPARGHAWAHSTLGAVVHNALRAFFLLPPRQRAPERAAGLVEELWSDEGFRDDAQAAVYRERARGWVGAYVAEHPVDTDPVGLERWVAAPVGTIVAEGRVDRIDQRDGPDGPEMVVVDYKTGRSEPDDHAARASQALALYALAVRRTLRRPCHRVELHHLPSGRVAAAEHDEASLTRHRTRAEESAADMALATDTLAAGGDPELLFPPSPGPRCGSCDMRRHCPEGREAAPELASWALLAP